MTRSQRIRRAEERVLLAAEKWAKDVGSIVWSTEGNLIAALQALQHARKAAEHREEGQVSERFDSGLHCAHGLVSCDACTDASSIRDRTLRAQLATAIRERDEARARCAELERFELVQAVGSRPKETK